MEKIQFSRNTKSTSNSIQFVLIIGIGLYYVVKLLLEGDINNALWVAGVGTFAMLISWEIASEKVFLYDEENVYVRNKNTEEKIPIKNIVSISYSKPLSVYLTRGFNTYRQMAYLDSAGSNKFLNFTPKFYTKEYDGFKKKLKERNPAVEIYESIDTISNLDV